MQALSLNDWGSLLYMIGGTIIAIYTALATNNRWIRILAPFAYAFSLELMDARFQPNHEFQWGIGAVFGGVFWLLGYIGERQWRTHLQNVEKKSKSNTGSN